MEHVCYIYVLFNKDGVIDYVGRTSRLNMKRMYEHKAKLRYLPKYEIVDSCTTNCRLIEGVWIQHYRNLGYKLRNVSFGQGVHFVAESTRRILSEKLKGRPNTWGHKISATQKGVKKNWSAEGEQRVRSTQFKAGHGSFNNLSPDAKERRRNSARAAWEDPERAARMASGRRNDAWSKLSPERKAGIAEAMRNKALNDPRKTEYARMGFAARIAKNPDAPRQMVNKFWTDIRKDPVRYREFIDRRAAAIAATRAAKRNFA